MRAQGPPSEIGRLAAPLARLLDAAWQRMHWWVALMLLLYAGSGTTIVKPDEVAVILRWGRLVGHTPALQEHAAGLLFAFPRPIDRVVRVPVKRISEVTVETLSRNTDPAEQEEQDQEYYATGASLDPIVQGYALTGDQNVVHAEVVARYRVRDAAEWAFYGPKVDDVLRVEVGSALGQSLGEMGVDRVLSDGRKDLIATSIRRAQAGLDACHSGLELSSLELTRLAPPRALRTDFDAVQSAYIGAETVRKEAQAYAETTIPQAQAAAEAQIQAARGAAESELATARGEAAAFLALDREYRANTAVVRERLYRDGVERALKAAGEVRWVPPPTGGKYGGLRISLPATPGTRSTTTLQDDDR